MTPRWQQLPAAAAEELGPLPELRGHDSAAVRATGLKPPLTGLKALGTVPEALSSSNAADASYQVSKFGK